MPNACLSNNMAVYIIIPAIRYMWFRLNKKKFFVIICAMNYEAT